MSVKNQENSEPVILQQKVFTKSDYLTFSLLTVVSYAAIIYFMGLWFSTGDWSVYPLTFLLLTLIFFAKLSISQLRWWVLPFMTKPLGIAPRPNLRVGTATTFVPGAEPIEMLEQTVQAMIAMDYPHDTWVLDEGDDAEVKALCARLGAKHFSRKNLPAYQTADGAFQSGSKHGNYNSWLFEKGFEKYEIVAAFDPDHIPEPNFLTEVLGYFNDPKIGYVQAAQVYYNQQASFIARGAAEETYTYYSSNQMFFHAMGHPILTGCHNTHRVTALREVGGFAAHDADDLLITLNYRASDWGGIYVPKILAKGLTPVDWKGYLKQQLRWARSVLDIKFRIHPKMVGKLPFKETVLSFLHGFYYLQGATTLIILLLIAFMLATGAVPKAVDYILSLNFLLLVTVLMVCDLFRQRFYLDRKNEWGLHWRAGLLQLAKYPYLILALFQVILNRRFQYVLTSKVKEQTATYKPFIPHLTVAAIICAAWIFGILSGSEPHLLIKLAAGFALVGTLLLVGTGYKRFPDPFDPTLITSADPAPKKLAAGQGGKFALIHLLYAGEIQAQLLY